MAKGKTWGPSTCHQRSRTRQRPIEAVGASVEGRSQKWSQSAPDLEKPIHSGECF